MASICLYFQVHQPYRLRPYGIFDIGQKHDYFDTIKNKQICRKVAEKCYLPANKLMLELLEKYPEFKITYSISGVALDQFAEYSPKVLASFQALVATGRVELLSETYYHSLSSVLDVEEFKQQIFLHKNRLREVFKFTPSVFRNTELIYSDTIAGIVKKLGLKGMLVEGADRVLKKASPNNLYTSPNGLILLPKNYQLSDDIAFRFSDKSWKEWPLKADKYTSWLESQLPKADCINLFMDYETIGEHQWESSGIFEFFRALPGNILASNKFDFVTTSEAIKRYQPVGIFSSPEPLSWADQERDLSAWLSNDMQTSMAEWLYGLGEKIKKSNDRTLLEQWRKLQTSDHFYYMCTKFWNDGDVHKYFSAYETPHEAYMIMNNVLSDLELRIKRLAETHKKEGLAVKRRPRRRSSQ